MLAEYEWSVDAVAPGASVVEGSCRSPRRIRGLARTGIALRAPLDGGGPPSLIPLGAPAIGAEVVRAMQYAVGVAGLDSSMRRAKQATDVKSVQSLRSGKDFQSRLLSAYPVKTPVVRRPRLVPSIRPI